MILRPNRLPFQGRPHPTPRVVPKVYPRFFHASRSLRASEGIPNHYETLGIQPNATAAEVKKNFYALSKTHHPDHNPNDPQASTRFVAISEAYATLGSTEKRSRYDRDFLRSHPPSGPQPQGSYSSHSQNTPAGGRPASGLSRRRTQFRGPPPSFYRSGGWGTQGNKRAEHASKSSHAQEAGGNPEGEAGPQSSAYDAPGTGPSGFSHGYDNDVPHFDRDGHFRTQESVQRARHRARRKAAGEQRESLEMENSGPSVLFNFVLLSGVLATIVGVTGLFSGQDKPIGVVGKKKEQMVRN